MMANIREIAAHVLRLISHGDPLYPGMQIIPASGGLSTFLFKLAASADAPASIRGPLGKLEIRWRGSMGESGRLQTQQIQAPYPAAAEIQV